MGDGTLGWQEFAPFDKIIVTASSPDIPRLLLDQLSEGGRLVIPVGSRSSQRLMFVDKKKNNDELEKILLDESARSRVISDLQGLAAEIDQPGSVETAARLVLELSREKPLPPEQ